MKLTQELVIGLFDYHEDGYLIWRVKVKQSSKKAGERAGYSFETTSGTRIQIGIKGKLYYSSRLIFLYHKGYMPDVVDHENHDTSDEKIQNLRDASHSQNSRNQTSHKDSTSTYLGVCKVKNSWQVVICSNGKSKYIGRFKKEITAALAYNKEAVKIHGEFANLNIINPTI